MSKSFNVYKVKIYNTDMTTRFVMQDHKDPRAFTIVERYENEGSQK